MATVMNNIRYTDLVNKNRGYKSDIDYHLLAYELGKVIKEENILANCSVRPKKTYFVRFVLLEETKELFSWPYAENIPRVGEMVTPDKNVDGKLMCDVKWFSVQEIFYLNDTDVICSVSTYKPLKRI